MATLDASELDFEVPANEMTMAVERRASLPPILAWRLGQLQALGHPPAPPPPVAGAGTGGVIDARGRFRRRG